MTFAASPTEGEIRVLPVRGIPEVAQNDDLGRLIVRAYPGDEVVDGDVVVVAHKAISKAEGRVVQATDRPAVAEGESTRLLRRSGDMVISETRHGFVCANAGVDAPAARDPRRGTAGVVTRVGRQTIVSQSSHNPGGRPRAREPPPKRADGSAGVGITCVFWRAEP